MSTTAYLCPKHGLIQRLVDGPIEVVPQSKFDEVVEALKRVMRNQAKLAEVAHLYDGHHLAVELAESRDQAKDALGYPKMEHR